MKSMKTAKNIFILTTICISLSILTYLISPPIVRDYFNAVIDESTCIPSKAKALGVPDDYPSIRDHILSLLTPGMRRDDVYKTLESIAPIYIGSVMNDSEGSSEQIIVELCGGNPFNNIVLRVIYSQDGSLILAYDVYEE